MKKVISIILSLLMTALTAFVPGLFGEADGISTGDWLGLVVVEFGMEENTYSSAPHYADITSENKYFAVVQIAYEWGIITDDDKIDVDADVSRSFVVDTLTRVAAIEAKDLSILPSFIKANKKDAIKALADAKNIWANQSFEDTSSEFVADDGVKDLSGVAYQIAADGKLVYAAKDFNLAVGATFIAGVTAQNLSGAAYKVLGVSKENGLAYVDVEAVALEDAVESIDFESSFAPDLTKAEVKDNKGEVIQEATVGEAAASAEGVSLVSDLVDKAKGACEDGIEKLLDNGVSFSVKGFKIKGSYSNNTIYLSVGGNVVDGVYASKSYAISNLDVDAAYDANLAKLQINKAYFTMNYDLVETTVLQGSYAGSVVPGDASESDEAKDFLDKVKSTLGNLKLVNGGGITVNVFTFNIPIGTTGLTVALDVSLTISACGRIEIIVSSNETKGYEIINNKGRYISESTVYDRLYNISGSFEVVLGLDISLTFMTFKIIDVGVQGGIGAYVLTQVFHEDTHTKQDLGNIPLSIAVETTAGLDGADDLRFCANVELYGILRISVGEKSIISKIGLSKTWTIYDRSNGVFATLHIENEGIVPECTYA